MRARASGSGCGTGTPNFTKLRLGVGSQRRKRIILDDACVVVGGKSLCSVLRKFAPASNWPGRPGCKADSGSPARSSARRRPGTLRECNRNCATRKSPSASTSCTSRRRCSACVSRGCRVFLQERLERALGLERFLAVAVGLFHLRNAPWPLAFARRRLHRGTGKSDEVLVFGDGLRQAGGSAFLVIGIRDFQLGFGQIFAVRIRVDQGLQCQPANVEAACLMSFVAFRTAPCPVRPTCRAGAAAFLRRSSRSASNCQRSRANASQIPTPIVHS